MDKLNFLSDRQKAAYLLRAEGLSYREIGQREGVCPGTARRRVKEAQLRIQAYARHMEQAEDGATVDFPLTRQEARLVFHAIDKLYTDLCLKARLRGGEDWEKHLSFDAPIVKDLRARAESAMGGRE